MCRNKERADKVRSLLSEAAAHINELRKQGYNANGRFDMCYGGTIKIAFWATKQVEEKL